LPEVICNTSPLQYLHQIRLLHILMLGTETADAVVVIDDWLARQMAGVLRLQIKGTLGLLLDAKKRGLLSAVKPYVDALHDLRFRLSPETRQAVLSLAQEAD
jgi:uncharacterized protein